MKNVAIMTYHDMLNYGSFFQMFALQEMLKSIGCNVKVINYKPNSNKFKKAVNNIKFLKYIWLLVRNDRLWFEFNRCYDTKINKTRVVSTLNELKKLNSEFDIFIAGSDQIWSPNHYDIHYFLDYVDDTKKRISYAPSVVIDDFSKQQIEEIKKELDLFYAVSCREATSNNILFKNFGINSTVVLDPTLAVNLDFYYSIRSEKTQLYANDILCYFLGDNDYSKYYDDIKKKYGYKKNINICIDNKITSNILNLNDVNPFDFINYIINSKIILTDSFHGVALSIKLNKQFIYFDRFRKDDPICQNSRIYDLFNLLSIKNVSYSDYRKGNYKPIDYTKVNNILNKEMQKSSEFLCFAILEKKYDK